MRLPNSQVRLKRTPSKGWSQASIKTVEMEKENVAATLSLTDLLIVGDARSSFNGSSVLDDWIASVAGMRSGAYSERSVFRQLEQ